MNSKFFTIARFGPDSIAILSLIAILAVLLGENGLIYLAVISIAVLLVIAGVESAEHITLRRPEERRLVGAKCIVVRKISRGERGIVRVFNSSGEADPELWSAESRSEIEEGKIANVVGIRSIILQISGE